MPVSQIYHPTQVAHPEEFYVLYLEIHLLYTSTMHYNSRYSHQFEEKIHPEIKEWFDVGAVLA